MNRVLAASAAAAPTLELGTPAVRASDLAAGRSTMSSYSYGGQGSYATPGGVNQVPAAPTYGNAAIIPSDWRLRWCAAPVRRRRVLGGGALLIAATGRITINGQVQANAAGGGHTGSGGAIRLVADEVVGTGTHCGRRVPGRG